MLLRLLALNVGKPASLGGNGLSVVSAFAKQSMDQPVFLSEVNLEGDGQADLKHHGGPDKAVCAYPAAHYSYWEERFNRLFKPGAFGENLTLEGVKEEDISIGDIFRWGEAVVQVSQPRQPCFKIGVYHGIPDFAAYVEQTGYTGFYFRVLKTGLVSQQDCLERLEQDPACFNVAMANEVMFRSKTDRQAIAELLAVPALSASWRSTLTNRLAKLSQNI